MGNLDTLCLMIRLQATALAGVLGRVARENLVGRVVTFDGDHFEIEFVRETIA